MLCFSALILWSIIHRSDSSFLFGKNQIQSLSSARFRSVMTVISGISFIGLPNEPILAVDPVELRQFAKPESEFRLYGDGNLEEKLKKYRDAQNVLDAVDMPFEVLPSGVSFRQYRDGKGNREIQKGSEVSAQMTIRCKSFATRDEPGGVKYYSTIKDTVGDQLTWVIGSGQLLPGLEEGMLGMKRNSVRRIEIPSTQVFAANKKGQLPLPAVANTDGQRRFKNLFKTDATLLFEVEVIKINDPIIYSSPSGDVVN